MPSDLPDIHQEMIALLGRIVGTGPLPPDLQRKALEMLAELAVPSGHALGALATTSPGLIPTGSTAAPPLGGPAAGNRRLIYVHGICRHVQHFSDSWWNALHPFVPSAFGEGVLGQTRLEVIWSDIVNVASATLAAAAAGADSSLAGGPAFGLPGRALAVQANRTRTAEEIKEALRDRADQHVLHAAVRTDGVVGATPLAAAPTSGLVTIPGLSCIDDFSIYLIDDSVRQQIIDRFIAIVRPELQAGPELDVVAHSWGTVVAYEGLRQLEDEGLNTPLVRNLFTVGAALSIGPVKMRLRDANKNGKKPANVRQWWNLDAHGDLVGGPLKGRPYAVDADFLNLESVGCSSFLGIVDPRCAHSSYFDRTNTAVNQGIFARFINES